MAVGLLGAGIFLALTRENANIAEGKRLLESGDFRGASSAFRLALQDQKEDKAAKGLLAYAVMRESVRQEIESSDSDADVIDEEDLLLDRFTEWFSVAKYKAVVDQYASESNRKQIQGQIKDYETSLRDAFAEERLPFIDWEDFDASMTAAARELIGLKIDEGNPSDGRAVDLAHVWLASKGDKESAKEVVIRLSRDRKLAFAALFCGAQLSEHLSAQAGSEASFMAVDAGVVQGILDAIVAISDFGKEKKWRMMRRADLPEDQRPLLDGDSESLPFINFTDISQYVALEAAQRGNFDPSRLAVSLEYVDDEIFVFASGYDGASRQNLLSAGRIDQSGFSPLAFSTRSDGLFASSLPLGGRYMINTEDAWLRIGIRKREKVTKSRVDEGVREVTRFRSEVQYSPAANDGYGGYVTVQVPYQDYESYSSVVKYQEPENGAVWVQLSIIDDGALKEVKRSWVSDTEDVDSAFEAKSPATTEGGLRRAKVDELILATMTRELVASDLEGLSKPELRMIRNGLFARKGYRFKDQELHGFFRLYGWYQPTITDLEVASSLISDEESANLDLVKAYESS